MEFTLPVLGKKLEWGPLKVGKDLDIRSANVKTSLELQSVLLLIARITKYGDKDKCDLADVRDWDQLDLEAFGDEVTLRENERRAALIATRGPGTPLANLEQAMESMQLASAQFGAALGQVLACARAADGADPLARK